jgi:hypothetical protein
MKSQQWSTLVSVLVFALVLWTSGSARAQWGFPGISDHPGVSLGLGFGAAQGFSPFGYGSFGATGSAGLGTFVGFPLPGYSLSTGQRPQATASFQSVSNVATLVPSWSGRTHRVRRRH